jgi:hypothetical protein
MSAASSPGQLHVSAKRRWRDLYACAPAFPLVRGQQLVIRLGLLPTSASLGPLQCGLGDEV